MGKRFKNRMKTIHAQASTTPGDPAVLVSNSTTTSTTKRSSSLLSLRTVLLDAPLLIVLTLYASVAWIHHVYDAYLEPQMEAMSWNEQRMQQEVTYYQRHCDARDISTQDAADLIMSPNATAQNSLESILKHGFAMFPSVLGRDTASELRRYVVGRNKNISTDFDAVTGLHEPQHRQSFSMNTDTPIARKVLMEVANHEQLSKAMAAALGDDPALVEISTITNAYGCADQKYHPDVWIGASATLYARSYSPTYSVFIQLQDTTEEMGATSACAGSHVCTGDAVDTEELCEQEGFQVVNEDGIWPAGDALMMYSSTFHRGSAHRDPNALDRVMLVLVFTAKPQSVAESRQVSPGLSGCWDAWGFTWNDMKRADTVMVPPLTYLRTLGLYKPPSSSWGIDYLTISSMRIMQKDWIFAEETLKELLESGGIRVPYLPSFLHGDMDLDDDFPWCRFLWSTLVKIVSFSRSIAAVSILGYMCLSTALSVVQWRRQFVCQSTLRFCLICSTVYLAFVMARQHVDSTQWAKDIVAGRRFSSVMDNEADFVQQPTGPTTFPNRHDVLIESRYGSAHLGMHDNYIKGAHHGNVFFYKLVQQASSTYTAYPEKFRRATASQIVQTVALNHGRFLDQGHYGSWHRRADDQEIMSFTRKELAKSASPRLGYLMEGIRQAIVSYRFGIYRDSVLASKHMVPFLRNLEARLFDESRLVMTGSKIEHSIRQAPVVRTPSTPVKGKSNTRAFQPLSKSFETLPKTRDVKDYMLPPNFAMTPREPTRGAWLEAGDAVEGLVDGYWYVGRILSMSAHKIYHVEFANGANDYVNHRGGEIRVFEPYDAGESSLEFLVDHDGYMYDEAYESCKIVSYNENNDHYNIVLVRDGETDTDNVYIPDVSHIFLRRKEEG